MVKIKPDVRRSERPQDALRDVKIEIDITENALASVIWRQGNTVVLACATCARSLPRWMPKDADRGWIHAEYSLLPASTDTRFGRERRGAKGRTAEIERLIARSLRSSADLEALGPLSITIDCDVLNADGGTRCASISAAMVALRLAVRRLIAQGRCLPTELRPEFDEKATTLNSEQKAAHEATVLPHDIAAISVGLVDKEVYLDLDYALDANADVDMNVVMRDDGTFVEIQGTGEEASYSRTELDQLIDLASQGITELQQKIREACKL